MWACESTTQRSHHRSNGFLTGCKRLKVLDLKIFFFKNKFNLLLVRLWNCYQPGIVLISIVDAILWPFNRFLSPICLYLDGGNPFGNFGFVDSLDTILFLLVLDMRMLFLHVKQPLSSSDLHVMAVVFQRFCTEYCTFKVIIVFDNVAHVKILVILLEFCVLYSGLSYILKVLIVVESFVGFELLC